MNIDIDIDIFRYQWYYQRSVRYLCTSFLDAIIPYKRKRLQEFEFEKEFVNCQSLKLKRDLLKFVLGVSAVIGNSGYANYWQSPKNNWQRKAYLYDVGDESDVLGH